MPKNESLVEKAYEKLKLKILDQELRQGPPVVEAEIAVELKMSRTNINDSEFVEALVDAFLEVS